MRRVVVLGLVCLLGCIGVVEAWAFGAGSQAHVPVPAVEKAHVGTFRTDVDRRLAARGPG